MKKREPFYNNIEKYVIIVLLILMTAITAFTVFTRFFFNFTLSWAEQMSRLMLVWISFAGISWAGRMDVHMRVTAITLVTKKRPQVAEGVMWFGDLITIIYGFYLSYKIGVFMVMIMRQGQILSAMPWMPKWIMYLAGVLGMAGLSVRVIQRRIVWIKDKKQAGGEAV